VGDTFALYKEGNLKEEPSRKELLYGDDHIYDPLFGFFDHIVYTDEAHVDLTSQAQGRVL
jgi:hypothetical protein